MTKEQIAILRQTVDADLANKELTDINLVPELEKRLDKAKADGQAAVASVQDAAKKAAEEAKATADAAIAAALAKAAAELKTAVDPLNAQIATLTAVVAERDIAAKAASEQIAALTRDLADETSKCQNMAGHPDVIAAKKEAAAKAREVARVKAKADIETAEKLLKELDGENAASVEVMPAIIAQEIKA